MSQRIGVATSGLMRPIHQRALTELLKGQGVTCGMSHAGEVRDNRAMERKFSSLKTEHTARRCRSRKQAHADLLDYIERFYDPTRRHSTLGNVSPFERAQKAQVGAHETGSSSSQQRPKTQSKRYKPGTLVTEMWRDDA